VQEASSIAAMNLGGNFHGSLFDMVVHAGFVVQLVLLLLLFFSVISWAIILMKYVNIRKIRKENAAFLSVYMRSTKLSEIFPEAKKFQNSTLAEVFRGGVYRAREDHQSVAGNPGGQGHGGSGGAGSGDRGARQCGEGIE